MEKLSNEKISKVAGAFRINSPADLGLLGNPEAVLTEIGEQTSHMISIYNAGHPFEMLPKSPGQIISQLKSGESVVIVSVNSPLTVLYHGTIYPNFSEKEADFLGFQVVEAGSAITHSDYRNGYGLGTEGAKMRVSLAKRLHPQTICLSTNKQSLTTRVLEHAGMVPVSFWAYPYLSFLTCTCVNCSESAGFTSCIFRRPLLESSPQALLGILDRSQPTGKMPCTLVISSPDLAAAFEDRCRSLHAGFGQKPLFPGRITPKSMIQARDFFIKVASGVKSL
jgi:hypothetical protein